MVEKSAAINPASFTAVWRNIRSCIEASKDFVYGGAAYSADVKQE